MQCNAALLLRIAGRCPAPSPNIVLVRVLAQVHLVSPGLAVGQEEIPTQAPLDREKGVGVSACCESYGTSLGLSQLHRLSTHFKPRGFTHSDDLGRSCRLRFVDLRSFFHVLDAHRLG